MTPRSPPFTQMLSMEPVETPDHSNWLSDTEVAEEMKTTLLRVRNWIDTGELPALDLSRPNVRILYINPADLAKFKETHKPGRRVPESTLKKRREEDEQFARILQNMEFLKRKPRRGKSKATPQSPTPASIVS